MVKTDATQLYNQLEIFSPFLLLLCQPSEACDPAWPRWLCFAILVQEDVTNLEILHHDGFFILFD